MRDSPVAQRSLLFANRTRHTRWLAILAVPLIALIAPPPRPPWAHDLTETLAVICLVICLVGRGWCSIYIAGRKDAELVTSGPYSMTRNPLYVFSFIGVVGIGLITEVMSVLAAAVAVFVTYYGVVVRREEKYLAALHGAAYADYRARVPRWIPDVSQWRDAERLDVRPKHIVTHLLDSSLFFLAFVLFEILEFLRAAQILTPLVTLP
ncbi:MAG: isoprenylcysteine carboxylmethyltransferase family protein [Hyphomicrobiales bacterium]|nr:isoprenylcysteine carboxylmethyltransferase family protein [Hyphomicrobiales bacterium]